MSRINVCTVCPEIRAANPAYNCAQILNTLDFIYKEAFADIILMPELALTGSACGEMFRNSDFRKQVISSCDAIREGSREQIVIFGAPVYIDDCLHDCAIIVSNGAYLGIVPATYVNYSGISRNHRGFSSWAAQGIREIGLGGQPAIAGQPLIFCSPGNDFKFGVEIGNDGIAARPVASYLATAGALAVFNLAALRMTVNSLATWQRSMASQSWSAGMAYFLQSGSPGDSTAESVAENASLAYVCGRQLCPTTHIRPGSQLSFYSVDTEIIRAFRSDRQALMREPLKFVAPRSVPVPFRSSSPGLSGEQYPKEPFLENLPVELVCERIVDIQCAALFQKLRSMNTERIVIGISGGQDSAATLLSIVETYRRYNLDLKNIMAVTLPGPGTSERTFSNARRLIEALNLARMNIDIKSAIQNNLDQISHRGQAHDRTYQQTQSRERTRILMDLATMHEALYVGTLNLSEIALGWMSYSGDQISMYALNCGIPKSMIPNLCRWHSSRLKAKVAEVVEDILACPPSPELLPLDGEGLQRQATEAIIGPYPVHDFFLYYFLKYNLALSKIQAMACQAFRDEYSEAEIRQWLKDFAVRFFTRRYKSACLPDGPQVFGVSLSNPLLWEMPGDIDPSIWTG